MNDATILDLVEAVRANDAVRVRVLLQEHPEWGDQALSYGDERRPIHFAVMNRAPEMVRLLVQFGASARRGIYPHRGATTARTMASERDYAEIVAILERADERVLSAQEEQSANPAQARVAAGDLDWLRTEYAAGTLRNEAGRDGGGLLTAAVRHNQPEVLRLLLEFGFGPEEQSHPLWQCAALDRREMATLLLQHGADPNAPVDSSGSAVYSAYSHGKWEMVELLRSHGGVVGADTAALYRQTEMARQMLEEGQPVAEELLRFGACGGDPEIVRMGLERIDWPREDPRWFGCLTEPLSFWHQIPWLYAGDRTLDRGNYLRCFRLILERCGPHVCGSFGRSPLHEVAAMGEHVTEREGAAFARALLDAGARTDVRDELLESTPLGWACRWGRHSVAEALLESGADAVEAEAPPWAGPRAWAEKRGQERVLQLLGSYGG